jgi:hypothetical protein
MYGISPIVRNCGKEGDPPILYILLGEGVKRLVLFWFQGCVRDVESIMVCRLATRCILCAPLAAIWQINVAASAADRGKMWRLFRMPLTFALPVLVHSISLPWTAWRSSTSSRPAAVISRSRHFCMIVTTKSSTNLRNLSTGTGVYVLVVVIGEYWLGRHEWFGGFLPQ